MWLLFAVGSAFFAGVTTVLAKCGIRRTDSDVATAIRTAVVLLVSWMMVFLVKAQEGLTLISSRSLVFLVLSGLSTGGSWLCYFKALKLGDINKVVPVDKSSTVLTILMAFFLLGEEMSFAKVLGMAAIGAGTFLMIQKKEDTSGNLKQGRNWLFYAVCSAIFASLTSILGKIGISGVESNLGTAIRTIVVLVMAWGIVFAKGKHGQIRGISGREFSFICLSGLATGASWLCYYKALQEGPASLVVPIDKMSILVTVAFSCLVLHERLNRREALGLAILTAGTLGMLF